MGIEKLFKRRLQFFTGKGGVGKSTVVAALGIKAVQMGKRVLIVEIDTASAMKRIFQAPFVGFVPLEVLDNLVVININPEEALQEYLEEHVRIRRIAHLIANNGVLRYFFKTAPAVNELVTINKLQSLVNERDTAGTAPLYDLILVDLPATGHALSFLKLTRNLEHLVGKGPLFKILLRYDRLFNDPAHTALNLITLPEDMPVTETIELYDTIRRELEIPFGALFVNAVPDELFDPADILLFERLEEAAEHMPEFAAAFETGRAAIQRQKRSHKHIERLARRVGLDLVRLPKLVLERLDLEALQQLARAIPGPA